MKDTFCFIINRNNEGDESIIKEIKRTQNELTKARALFDLNRNEEGYSLLMEIKSAHQNNKLFHSLLAQYYFQKE